MTIPAAGGSTAIGTPTGVIANATGQFDVTANGKTASPAFIFATLDGTISGWSPKVDSTHAIIAVDRSGIGASYTALANRWETIAASITFGTPSRNPLQK